MFDDIAFALRRVVGTRERRRTLLADPRTPLDLVRFLTRVVPLAASELAKLRDSAGRIPDDELRVQALASIDSKAFHVAGAAILATFLPDDAARRYVEIVTPLETIYDYLDNLCDRHPSVDAAAYPRLHRAIADALDPLALPTDYYADGPAGSDGGYLRDLVVRTQGALASAPHLALLRPAFSDAARFYGELQTYKHLPRGARDIACVNWYERHRSRFGELDWHEFACACGSNMHVFAALFEAFCDRPESIRPAYDAYFPFVAALHILLDSVIDRAEDREHDDLNFAEVYGGRADLRRRFVWMQSRARQRLDALPGRREHRFVLRVMTLFYLSHPKIAEGRLEREARELLRANAHP